MASVEQAIRMRDAFQAYAGNTKANIDPAFVMAGYLADLLADGGCTSKTLAIIRDVSERFDPYTNSGANPPSSDEQFQSSLADALARLDARAEAACDTLRARSPGRPPRSAAPVLPNASVIRIQSGREWVDVLVHDDGRLFLSGYNLGPDVDADEARAVADELRQSPKGMMAGLYDAGPWVDHLGQPLPGQCLD